MIRRHLALMCVCVDAKLLDEIEERDMPKYAHRAFPFPFFQMGTKTLNPLEEPLKSG